MEKQCYNVCVVKQTRIYGVLALLVVASFVFYRIPLGVETGPEEREHAETEEKGLVTTVVDGDTIEVTYSDGDRERVRLIGVDTPEIDWEEMRAGCYGFEARSFLSELIKGESIRLETDSTQPRYDTYDRLLAYVYIPDEETEDELANLTLLKEGYAREMTVGEPYEYRDIFLDAEQKARRDKRGRWAVCEI